MLLLLLTGLSYALKALKTHSQRYGLHAHLMILPLKLVQLHVNAAANELELVNSTNAQVMPGASSPPIRIYLISPACWIVDF